jgi:glycosyltransferase involved in cell wall biosynthesis
MPEIQAIEADSTYYIKATGVSHALWISGKTLLTRPRVFFRGAEAALKMGRGNIVPTCFALFYFVEALILGDWMRLRGLRHLHIHFCGPVATVGMLASISWRFPYSLMVHGPDEFYDVDKFYLRQKIERAQFVFCISDYCRSQLMRIASPQHWDKMQVVRLGVDPDRFVPATQEESSERVPEIICVGRLVPSKGQLILLRACALLLSRGYGFQVRIVGDGPDRSQLEAYAAEKGIAVVFEGARSHEETRALLGKADIFALSSFAEGVPVALMEAMAMEIPCVSTSIAGIPELIRDGFNGLLVPASSSAAFASALQLLLDDPGLRRSLGVAGRKYVADHYNLRINVSQLASLFRNFAADIN